MGRLGIASDTGLSLGKNYVEEGLVHDVVPGLNGAASAHKFRTGCLFAGSAMKFSAWVKMLQLQGTRVVRGLCSYDFKNATTMAWLL